MKANYYYFGIFGLKNRDISTAMKTNETGCLHKSSMVKCFQLYDAKNVSLLRDDVYADISSFFIPFQSLSSMA